MNTPIAIDESTFCRMTRFYAKTFHLPPLASKIYSYLTFDFDRKGLPFDELIEIFSASKSSVSTNLSLLISNNLVQDHNKLDERKRYFTVNDNFVKIRFSEIVSCMKEEIEIINALDGFKQESSNHSHERIDIYKNLLQKNINNIEKSLSKL